MDTGTKTVGGAFQEVLYALKSGGGTYPFVQILNAFQCPNKARRVPFRRSCYPFWIKELFILNGQCLAQTSSDILSSPVIRSAAASGHCTNLHRIPLHKQKSSRFLICGKKIM